MFEVQEFLLTISTTSISEPELKFISGQGCQGMMVAGAQHATLPCPTHVLKATVHSPIGWT